jgi:hypothetical protein
VRSPGPRPPFADLAFLQIRRTVDLNTDKLYKMYVQLMTAPQGKRQKRSEARLKGVSIT